MYLCERGAFSIQVCMGRAKEMKLWTESPCMESSPLIKLTYLFHWFSVAHRRGSVPVFFFVFHQFIIITNGETFHLFKKKMDKNIAVALKEYQ